jgi:hypothetical protein
MVLHFAFYVLSFSSAVIVSPTKRDGVSGFLLPLTPFAAGKIQGEIWLVISYN